MGEQYGLNGKIVITSNLKLLTGMHIGGSSDFAPIGAVDSPFIRDVLTQEPVIPGSSLKGKMRTLLARAMCSDIVLNSIEKDNPVIRRLFGSAESKNPKASRLQYYDVFMNKESSNYIKELDTDTYLGEIKFENTINRLTAVANPRQIERVPAGSEFDFKLVYNIEKDDEVNEDMNTLKEAFELLQIDYLGGHGSRGYGKVEFTDFSVKVVKLGGKENNIDAKKIKEMFEGSAI